MTFDVLRWTEKEGQRAGYAAREPLLAAHVVEVREVLCMDVCIADPHQ